MIEPRRLVYGWLVIAGIVITACTWQRITARDGRHDARLTVVYLCGLFGALLGAKLGYLVADGWNHRGDWMALLTGRSITGALLGGYLAVEVAKKALGYRETTGDVFAIIVPIALILGRVGCVFAGCCPGIECAPAWWTLELPVGIARWPAAPVEGIFNAVFLAWALVATRQGWQIGQRFHIYLMAYGLFRFAHEFLRDEPRVAGPFTAYHGIALLVGAFGLVRYLQRRAAGRPSLAAGAARGGETPGLVGRVADR